MPDIDPSLIGKIFSSLDYGQIIGTPLQAAIQAQVSASKATADFIMTLGFSGKEGEEKQVINTQFKHSIIAADGSKQEEVFEIPFICMTQIPNILISQRNDYIGCRNLPNLPP